MRAVLLLALVCLQVPLVESSDFSREVQTATVCATVRVTSATGTGSGVIVRAEGPFVYLLTAGHIVGNANTVAVDTFSAQSLPKTAKSYERVEVLGKARDADVALLRLVTRDPVPGTLPICPPTKLPTVKELPALTCGLGAKGLELRADKATGPVTIRKPTGETATAWELSRESTPGRSGGPMVDGRGYLLGTGSGRGDGKGFCVPVTEVYRLLKQHGLERLLEAP